MTNGKRGLGSKGEGRFAAESQGHPEATPPIAATLY